MSPEEARKYKKSGQAGKGWVKSKTNDKRDKNHHHKTGKDGKQTEKKPKEASTSGSHHYADSEFEK